MPALGGLTHKDVKIESVFFKPISMGSEDHKTYISVANYEILYVGEDT